MFVIIGGIVIMSASIVVGEVICCVDISVTVSVAGFSVVIVPDVATVIETSVDGFVLPFGICVVGESNVVPVVAVTFTTLTVVRTSISL